MNHVTAPSSFIYAPHVVAIGGGHGLSGLLRGLKTYTPNLTAIVTASDDGGGSGVLRQELGMPAPGDIRNCMQALANVEPLMAQLLDYRFTEGSLRGQSFGNLLLAALNGIFPSFDTAVAAMQHVLAITGQVLPVTAENVQLSALLENGARVVGESKIGVAKKDENCRISQISLLPEAPAPLPAVLEAIQAADLILVGPGSLYTSIIPNLLVPGIADALRASSAPRVYIANLMTQDGETEGYSVSDHIAALYCHGGEGLFSTCLVNTQPIPADLLSPAQSFGLSPVTVDYEAIHSLGLTVFESELVDTAAPYICHDTAKLTRSVRLIYETCAKIKVYQ